MSTESRLPRWLPWLWLLGLALVVLHQVQFWRDSRLDANVLALLPQQEQDALAVAAQQKLAALGERRVVVLVGAKTIEAATAAANAAGELLAADAMLLHRASNETRDAASLVQALRPWRDRLLTREQRHILRDADVAVLAEQALADLYQPFAAPRLTRWQDDPLSLWSAWWAERASAARARPRDGVLTVQGDGREWIVLGFDAVRGAFSVSGATPVSERIEAARAAAVGVANDAELLAAGVPLHAEAAAAQASFEVNTIGWGSLLAVLVLVWLTFRSLRPIALVALSLIVGCAAALSVTALLFGEVHLLTLVFGASLVGVAEDYGFHWFAARQGQPTTPVPSLLRHLLPGLLLALATSVVAYLALGLAPFPGLRQMAMFSATGLAAAFLTVVCLFPWLDRSAPRATPFASRFAASLAHWPRWRADTRGLVVAVALLVFVAIGLFQLRANDDLRQLHAAPPSLVEMQTRIGRLLGLPSPAQYFLIEGEDIDAVLESEERLSERLHALRARGTIAGYQALSQWLPSRARQEENARLSAAIETDVLARIGAATGDTPTRAVFAAEALTLADLERLPQAELLTRGWLGAHGGGVGSVVMLSGVDGAALSPLAEAAQGIDGVRFVDRSAEISVLLARYRIGMSALLAAGYLGVLLLLFWRYRGRAWRALTPTLIGSLLTLAIFGWMGWPLQLFGVLALLLLLGMGVDYGIFLLEHPGDGSAWLAVALAGISTLLAFGLLALSATPALHAFGLTMLLGETLIWLITPWLRTTATATPAASATH